MMRTLALVCSVLLLPAAAAYGNLGESASGETANLDAGHHADWLAQRMGEGMDAVGGLRAVDQVALEGAAALDQNKIDKMRTTCKNISVGALEAVRVGSELSTMQAVQNDTFKCSALVDVLEQDLHEKLAAKHLADMQAKLHKLEAEGAEMDKAVKAKVVDMKRFKTFKKKRTKDDKPKRKGYDIDGKNPYGDKKPKSRREKARIKQKRIMKSVGIDPKTGKASKNLAAKETKEDKKVAKIERKMERTQRKEERKEARTDARAARAMKLGYVKESKAAKRNDRREMRREAKTEKKANQRARDDARSARADDNLKQMERQKRNIDIDKAKREKGNSESELGEESSKDSSVVESPMFEQQDEEAQQEEEQEAAEAATYRRNDFDRNEEIREHDDDQYPSDDDEDAFDDDGDSLL